MHTNGKVSILENKNSEQGNQKESLVSFFTMKDFNETDVFKPTEYDSPCVLYFRKENKEQPIVLDIRKDLVKGSGLEQALKRLDVFIKAQMKEQVAKYNKMNKDSTIEINHVY